MTNVSVVEIVPKGPFFVLRQNLIISLVRVDVNNHPALVDAYVCGKSMVFGSDDHIRVETYGGEIPDALSTHRLPSFSGVAWEDDQAS
jgi:hypothetical protein